MTQADARLLDADAMDVSRDVLRFSVRPHNVFLAAVLLAGIGLVVYPHDLLPAHQTVIGVAAMGLALMAFVFWNADRSVGLREVLRRNRLAVGVVTLLTGFAVALAFVWEHPGLQGVGMLGIIVLLTTILAARIFDPDGGLSHRHVRTAIAVSCIATFYALVAFANDDPLAEGSVLSATFRHFWQVLIAVIGFYFGGITVEAVAARRRLPEAATPLPSGET